MIDNVFTIDYTRTLPPCLKDDEKMLSLAKVVAGELQKTIKLSRRSIIYARIDELDESVLDVLAYDLHVDWYDYTYPVEVKRAIIKDSVKVHKRLGTKYAVETALGNLAPNSCVEEWFEYEGQPYHFRISIDTTNSRIDIVIPEIIKTAKFYKRLSAFLDEVICQSSVILGIGIETKYYRYQNTMTGKTKSGTTPYRNIVSGVENSQINLSSSGKGNKFTSPIAGTIPQRNIYGSIEKSNLTSSIAANGFNYTVKRCGTSKTK